MKRTNEHLAGYLTEMRKANCVDDDYWRKDAGQIVRLTNGGYFVVKKSRIETSFCFGYHTDYTGHEHSDAEATRAAFLSCAENFKRENLKELDEKIKRLSDAPNWDNDYYPILERVEYYKQSEPLNVWRLNNLFYPQFFEKYGKDGYITQDTVKNVCISDADREIILNAYKAERESLNKRLDTYLKRYGTKNLRTWVYWLDE